LKKLLLATLLFSTFSIKAAYIVPMNGDGVVAFSPNGGATELVVKTIERAKSVALVQAYSFTSAPIAQALSQTKARGVDVRVILDNH